MSKGSTQRPTKIPQKELEEKWDNIFRKTNKSTKEKGE